MQKQTQQKAAPPPTPSLTPVHSGILQRKCACGGTSGPTGECSACRKKREATLQRAAVSPGPVNSAPAIVYDVLRGPGQSLNPATRAFMEPRFGHDFSQVRVHTDAKAAESARAVNALAYTVGQNVVFGSEQYAPGTQVGRRLLAHELTHTLQQGGGQESWATKIRLGGEQEPQEEIAEQTARAVLRRHSPIQNGQTLPNRVTYPMSGDSFAGSPVLRRTCSAHLAEAFYQTEVDARRYCQDSPGTSQLHPGQRCYRQVPTRTGYFDCPAGDQVCFDQEGHCHDSWDDASPVEETNDDGTCNLHGYCSLAHAFKDKVVQTWWDQNLTPVFERMGRQQLECAKECESLPWYSRGFCLQGCSGTPLGM